MTSFRQAPWRAIFAAAALAMLGACSQHPPPVHFFAEGRPQRLSEWHVVFREGRRLALNERVVPYDLNTPLFSDYAHKLRTVWMPPGTSAHYAADQTFDFPVGTVLSKTFFYPRAGGRPLTRFFSSRNPSHKMSGK